MSWRSYLCRACSLVDLPGILPVPLPAWSQPGQVPCINCGAMGEHRHTSIPLSHRQLRTGGEGDGDAMTTAEHIEQHTRGLQVLRKQHSFWERCRRRLLTGNPDSADLSKVNHAVDHFATRIRDEEELLEHYRRREKTDA